ncbi:MAG: sigma-54-dependent Fis family transcriptional regulator [Bacillaceae bacterium]|nr:sigma-54-dependent Fis family transcriptional regulator [Bacillaceae bacterium]
MNHRLLIVDDEEAICASLRYTFEDDFNVYTATDGKSALEYAEKHSPDIVLLDLKIGQESGLELLEPILKLCPQSRVIMMTAYGDIESSVQAMRKGAYAYIEKPLHMEELKLLIQKCLDHQQLTEKVNELQQEMEGKYSHHGIIGRSKAIKDIYVMIDKVKDIDSTVLVSGESGTGKELVARAIHYSGNRRQHPFVDVNCAAIPSELLESELFGYEKGAFTGAHQDKPGKFVQADGGTLFLDEVGELPLSLQSKLLRTIQEKEVTPLGSTKKVSVDTRIIAATNRDLKEEVKNGRFREDLYFRLNVIPIHIPSLKDRKEDIPPLVDHFMQQYNRSMGRDIQGIEPTAMEVLMKYAYPGNVRELSNVIERAVALSEGFNIKVSDLPRQVVEASIEAEFYSSEDPSRITFRFGTSLREVEKRFILFTLDKLDGHRKKTAEVLGISERGLRQKLKMYHEEAKQI